MRKSKIVWLIIGALGALTFGLFISWRLLNYEGGFPTITSIDMDSSTLVINTGIGLASGIRVDMAILLEGQNVPSINRRDLRLLSEHISVLSSHGYKILGIADKYRTSDGDRFSFDLRDLIIDSNSEHYIILFVDGAGLRCFAMEVRRVNIKKHQR